MEEREYIMATQRVKTNSDIHPMENLLRMDRMPHIWCPTCGIGLAVTAFTSALEKANIDPNNVSIVSGIGCTGRVAGYVKVDSFHTTHGRPIAFATGIKVASPKTKVVVFSGDGDLIAIGGNHFIHAARRNIDMLVVCVNNFIYAMTGGQVAPTTPLAAYATTSPYGCVEPPFNIPYLADSSGAVYVARYTALHIRRLTNALTEALNKNHEVIPGLYAIGNCAGGMYGASYDVSTTGGALGFAVNSGRIAGENVLEYLGK